MDERARRVGENEALYRTVNEKIEDLNATFGMSTESMTVVCECGHLQCMQPIELDVPTYERARSEGDALHRRPGTRDAGRRDPRRGERAVLRRAQGAGRPGRAGPRATDPRS